jgi:hypothetical protein
LEQQSIALVDALDVIGVGTYNLLWLSATGHWLAAWCWHRNRVPALAAVGKPPKLAVLLSFTHVCGVEVP